MNLGLKSSNVRLITGDNYDGKMIGFNLSSSAPVGVQTHHVEPGRLY